MVISHKSLCLHTATFFCIAFALNVGAQEPTGRVCDNQLVYSLPNSETRPPNAEEISRAVAELIPRLSKYGPLRDGKRTYSGTSVTAAGVRQTGLLYVDKSGVRTSTNRSSITVDYINGKRYTDGRKVVSSTTITLSVNPTGENPAVFCIDIGDTQERQGKEMFFINYPPLDSVDNVRSDLFSVVAHVKPVITRSKRHVVEFDTEYPPPAIFANFERAFGRGTRLVLSGDAREGLFEVRFSEFGQAPVLIKVTPYRNGSKVIADFSLSFDLRPDGGSTYSPNAPTEVEEALRKAAAQ